MSGDFEVASRLLFSSASESLGRKTFTELRLSLLHLLAFSSSPQFPTALLQALIRVGCDPGAKDDEGRTLTHLLIEYDRCEDLDSSIDALKAAIEETNGEGRRPLHEAAVRGSTRAIDALLRAGADVNAKSRKCGLTALHYAVVQRHEAAARRLLEAENVDVNAAGIGGCSALDFARESVRTGRQRMTEMRKRKKRCVMQDSLFLSLQL